MQQIIGQEELIKDLSRIFNIFVTSGGEIRPHFILTGPSGNSKTSAIAYLCAQHKINMLEINAAQLTKEGTSGNSLSKAMSPLIQAGNRLTVCFVDEFDKLFISGNSNDSHAHETTTGVQNEFLKVLEANTASVFGDYGKYVTVGTSKILFIFAGAFNGEEDITLDRLRDLGLKTEFLGRVGIVFNASKLTLDNLQDILKTSPLLDNYLRLFVDVNRDEVIKIIGDFIAENYEKNTLGARLVNTLIHQYFIKGGLNREEVEEMSFQKQLTFNS